MMLLGIIEMLGYGTDKGYLPLPTLYIYIYICNPDNGSFQINHELSEKGKH